MTVLSCMLRDAALGENGIEFVELAQMKDDTWRGIATTRDKAEHVVEGYDNPAMALSAVVAKAMGLEKYLVPPKSLPKPDDLEAMLG